MVLVGICGGIGSGKSVVSRILRLNGYQVYDCDTRARFLMEANEGLRKEICRLAGREAYCSDRTLNRAFLGNRLFSDAGLRDGINAAVHKAVRDNLREWTETDCGEICFVESALLATSGLDALCAEIWHVNAPEPSRIERIVRRNGISVEEACRRLESQREEEKMLGRIASEGGKVVEIENGEGSDILAQIDRQCRILKDTNK